MTSIRKKITITIAVLVALICITNLAVGMYFSNKGLLDNVKKDLKSSIELAEIAVANELENQTSQAKLIAEGITVVDNNYNQSLENIDGYIESCGYDAIGIVDKQGIVHSKSDGLEGLNLSNEEYYLQAKSGESHITTTVYNKKKEMKNFVLAAMPDGNVLIASLDYMTLSNLISGIRIGETGNVFVLDKDGIMIANMRREMVETRADYIAKGKAEKEYDSMGKTFARMKNQENDVDTYSLGGVERIIAFMPISNTDNWSIGAVAPIKEMTTSIKLIAMGMISSSIVLLVLGVLYGLSFAKKIGEPIKLCASRLELLSQGDLTTSVVEVNSKDEVGLLAEATAEIVENLKIIIGDISYLTGEMAEGNFDATSTCEERYIGDYHQIILAIQEISRNLSITLNEISNGAHQVNTGAGQVASAAQALSQGAIEQASSIEELSATMSEILIKIKRNAQKANQASGLSNDAGQDVLQGNKKMEQMSLAMEDIICKSNQIGNIIKTIDGIAFQTNILALNAAVEAARAGEAGKGFAVVADEVRNLAQKSAEAAQDTTILIESAIDAVKSGAELTSETAQALTSVVEKTEMVNNLIEEISCESEEQTKDVEQISLGIDQISSVVQTNSATAEESAAASEELSAQSDMLRDLVEKFKLAEVAN